MKAKHFIVVERPQLAAITKHPRVAFAEYERLLNSMQVTMQAIQQAYLGTRDRAVVVLEGWDAAGKGGIVRRLGWAMDPRSFKVYPIAAPLSHEAGKHYLQRFWEKLPDRGQIVVFDRSWYGRVLVERVEGFASKQEWKRGYEEINQFERMLVADGVRIVKCFLHITPAEQIRRFKDRLTNPLKRQGLGWPRTHADLQQPRLALRLLVQPLEWDHDQLLCGPDPKSWFYRPASKASASPPKSGTYVTCLFESWRSLALACDEKIARSMSQIGAGRFAA